MTFALQVASGTSSELLKLNELSEGDSVYWDDMMTASRSTGDCTTTTLTDDDEELVRLMVCLFQITLLMSRCQYVRNKKDWWILRIMDRKYSMHVTIAVPFDVKNVTTGCAPQK